MTLLQRTTTVISVVYNKLGDPRTKNAAIFVLMLMSAFGILAPATATSLRDMVLSMIGV
jgi:hypothetical protein